MNYWTIMRVPSEVLEGSEQHELLTVGGTDKKPFPTPTIFMEKAYVFCDYLPGAAEALKVEQKFNDDGEAINSLMDIAGEIEAYLDKNNTRCVWLSQGLAGQLYKLLVKTDQDI